MNKLMEILVFGGLGFGVGFFAGLRMGERKNNAKPVEFVDGEETYIRPGDPVFEEEVNRAVAERITQHEGYISDEQADAANAYFAQFESPQEEDPLTDDEDVIVEEAHPDISIITEDQYEAESDFEHRELYFYTEDLVVCDEDEKRMDDPEEIVGHDALNFLSSGESDVVYIRNAWTESVYRIEAIENAYGRVVLGLDE